MADPGAGQSTSRRNSTISPDLVSVPSMQELKQNMRDFDFDDFELKPDVDVAAELRAEIIAHNNAFGANPGVSDGRSLNGLQIIPESALNAGLEPSGLPQAYKLNDQDFPNDYSLTAFGSFPVQQGFAYPEPTGYYPAHEAPYFDNSYTLAPPGNYFGTMGLAAIPGNNTFAEFGDAQPVLQHYEYPAELWSLPGEGVSLPTAQTGYTPVDNVSYHDASMQFATYPPQEPNFPMETAFPIGPVPSSVSKDDSRHLESDSDSDGDYHDTESKHTRTSKQATRKKLRKDSVSSAGTSTPAPAVPAKYVPGEKPQKVDAKPWIRTNANTEGDTRTAKINNWRNKYEYKALPLGTWSSGKHTFKYTQYENVDFLTEAPMSTRRIKEYIMNYPSDEKKRLVLWIQKMPADQGRRYGSKQHSKCVFKDCPMQRYIEGTISTGEYRVAFDEKHYTYEDQVDPYDCAAYAHLYCMEQFLDFEQVCQTVDVRVDTRLDMPLEPNGKAAFSMVDVPARHEMERFVKAASKGKLRQTQRWRRYPVHADYNRDEQKPHEDTLTYLAHCMYEAHQDDSHKRQAALRRVTVSQRRVHLGDLEMSVADKRIMLEVYGGKKKSRNVKIEEHYDERILYHIARAEKEARDFLKNKRQKKDSAKRGKKRKIVEREESDEEQSAYDSTYEAQPRRLQARRQKKRRINYVESPVDTAVDAQPVLAPEQQVQQLQTYMTANHNQSSATVQPQPQDRIDPTLDTPYGLYVVPTTPKFDLSDFPTHEDDLPSDNLEKLLALERRQSISAEFSPTSILKSPAHARGAEMPRSAASTRPAASTRRAAFQAQPVSDSKEYRVNDPPSLMSGRRSARLAEKERLSERRMRKRARRAR
ncbi:hypothetical protein OPT61_g4108 [Boeremia exigua]|uniref:Uncharacterized protein n=1 Tax=Boeremia exigua TaxID=749465 RepID=A0ACC2IFE4_9PLEO|nr:hypothetical protein OPT61_g4108 [Boeremia exigua]